MTSLKAFAEYQRQNAWTWEHQALVRARVVAGSHTLAEKFNQLRGDILSTARDKSMLREEVVKMRQKMRDHLGSKPTADAFNIKHDAGGMVDIEFLCQYAVLALANQTPSLLTYSDNIRILESLTESGHLPAEEAERLREAYLAYRSATHRAALTGEKALSDGEAYRDHRDIVTALWQRFLEPSAGNNN